MLSKGFHNPTARRLSALPLPNRGRFAQGRRADPVLGQLDRLKHPPHPTRAQPRRWRTAVQVSPQGGDAWATDIPGVSIKFGPDGAMYVAGQEAMTLGSTAPWDGSGGGARPPTAAFTSSTAQGPAPLVVSFDNRSEVQSGAQVTYVWDFGDGATSSAFAPQHTYTNPGRYTVLLTVTDQNGLRGTATDEIQVTQSTRLRLAGVLRDASAQPTGPISNHPVSLAFFAAPDGSPIPASGPTFSTDATGAFDTTAVLQTTSTNILIELRSGSPETRDWVPLRRQIAVQSNTEVTLSDINIYVSSRAVWGRLLSPRGTPLGLDVGIRDASTDAPMSFPGGRPSASSPQGPGYLTEADVGGYFYIPMPVNDASGDGYIITVAEDSSRSEWVTYRRPLSLAQTTGAETQLTVGKPFDGRACRNIQDIPEVPNVDYSTQIQPLWTSYCIGCHRPNAPTSGGLDLRDDSYAQMVNVESYLVPGLLMVRPSAADASFLMEKVQCNDPQSGEPMPPTALMPDEDLALVRDWLNQGAKLTLDGPVPPTGGASGGSGGNPAGGGRAGNTSGTGAAGSGAGTGAAGSAGSNAAGAVAPLPAGSGSGASGTGDAGGAGAGDNGGTTASADTSGPSKDASSDGGGCVAGGRGDASWPSSWVLLVLLFAWSRRRHPGARR